MLVHLAVDTLCFCRCQVYVRFMYISTFPLKVAWAPTLGYAVDALVVQVLWSIHRLCHDSPQYVVQVPYHLFRTLLASLVIEISPLETRARGSTQDYHRFACTAVKIVSSDCTATNDLVLTQASAYRLEYRHNIC